MTKNLRIVSKNAVTAVNGLTSAKSLNDYKSQYDTGTSFTLTLDAMYSNSLIAVIVYLAENPGNLSMEIRNNNYNSQIGQVSGSIPVSYYNVSSPPIGYGSGGYFVAYIDPYAFGSPGSIVLLFNNTVKVSKFIVGPTWSPVYNVGYGVSVGYTDMTTVDRLHGGDQYAVIGPRHKTLRFDLQYVEETDKTYLLELSKIIGRSNTIFISVFPEDNDKAKEQMYSVIGRLLTPPNISYSMYSMYSTSLEIEEI